MTWANFTNAHQDILAFLFVMISFFLTIWIEENTSHKHTIYVGMWILYVYMIIKKTIGERTYRNEAPIMEFLWSYRALLSHQEGMLSQIYLNIMLFVPFGLFSFMLLRNNRIWRIVVPFVSGFVLTSLIEILQYKLKRGTFELDDIFNNMLGALIGVLLGACAKRIFVKRSKTNER